VQQAALRLDEIKRQEEQDHIESAHNKAVLDMETHYQNTWTPTVTGESATKPLENLKEDFNKIKSNYASTMESDRQREDFELQFDNSALYFLIRGSRLATSRFYDRSESILSDSLDRVERQGALTMDEGEHQRLLNLGLANIEDKEPLFGSFWVDQKTKEFKADYWDTVFRTQLNDPAMAGIVLTQWDQGDIWQKRLDPDNFPTYKKMINAAKTGLVAVQEGRDQEAERARKKLVAENDFRVLQLFHNNELTPVYLENLATKRLISEETYDDLSKRLRSGGVSGATENNPLVVGDLAEMIELGIDADERLREALRKGQITDSTFITMTRQAAEGKYKEGLSYLSSALKPSQMDKWSPDKHLKYAEAVDLFNSKVRKGMDPLTAGKEVVNLYTSDTRRTIRGLRRPVFLEGQKDSVVDLDVAEKLTVEAFLSGNLPKDEYEDEIRLINELREIVADLENVPEDLKQEAEKRRKK
jgi:hypothetical protein